MTNNTMESGKVLRVIGPVVDVSFAGELPEIYTALTVERTDKTLLTLEVQQHLGGGVVRTVAHPPLTACPAVCP